MKALYLDESGEHNPSALNLDYPIFVLGGIITDKDYADGPLTETLNDFKRQFLGTTDIVLHTADIARNQNGFESLKDADFRNRFYGRLNRLMGELQYSAVVCAIRKDTPDFRQFSARDLYLVCFEKLVELFCEEIGAARDGGMIVAERRASRPLDRALERVWSDLKINGVDHIAGSVITNRILALSLRAKRDNIAGLQMADLVISPIGRHLLGKPDFEDWRIVASKLRCNSMGETAEAGLIVLS